MSKHSKSKKMKSKSGPKSKGASSCGDQKAGAWASLVTNLVGHARFLQQQRTMLPGLMRAMVDSSLAILQAQAKRNHVVNIATAEALRPALGFRGLRTEEKGLLGRLMIALVKVVAEQQPELVTREARVMAEDFLGETLEESLKKDVRDFIDEADSSDYMELIEAGNAMKDLHEARHVRELQRLTAVIQRRLHPACVGDLEYFAKIVSHDPQFLKPAHEAIRLLQRLLTGAPNTVVQAANVISFNAAAGSLSFGPLAHSANVVGCLEVLLSHPEFGSYQRLALKLSEDEKSCLVGGLAAQIEMLALESNAIYAHPDLEDLAEFAGGIQELADFDPVAMLDAMIEREVAFTNLTAEIVQNKSVDAVRFLISDYLESLDDEEADSDESDFEDDDFEDDTDGDESRSWL
jgi:hypothetical protein